ncbi:MAG: 30S ribosomal protein S5 [Candidatus Dadabacteria bacterium]|nr:MAG: 30S ribosomal protein S5 [Candidatus Dadabacteria bacterium]
MDIKQIIAERRVLPSECGELKDKTVFINRVAKVVKGGRRFSFSALVVSGDGQGHVGFGLGKASEVPEAIRKGAEAARKSLIRVPIVGATIPHEIIGRHGPSQVVMKPGKPGTGVIAGSVARAVVEAAGLHDIRTKCIGSNNPLNVVQAVFAGLLSLKTAEMYSNVRRIPVEQLDYHIY